MLMYTDTFASSDIEIKTGVQPPFKAKDLFIHFNDVNEEHIQKWRGYWGVISHADSDISWLNVGNKRNVSVLVDSLKDYIIKMCKIESAEDLAGASVLVFGRLNISANGKRYIKINSNNPRYVFAKTAK